MVLEHTPPCLLRSGPGKRWHLARDALRVGEDGRQQAVSPGLLPRPAVCITLAQSTPPWLHAEGHLVPCHSRCALGRGGDTVER